MSELFDSLERGLKQAVAHANNTKKARTKKIVITELPKYTAAEIKGFRQKIELTQSAFAELLGISTKTVEAWESGRNNPNGSASRLLQLIDTNPEVLLQELTEPVLS
ncbi:type II toxin-antitoxin system MqsA family antitoxin [Listeria booriae]|uniref:Type II toxin-antitoxin system MqsA family antitoxin n=1 Tax=Listeria booriae TaxID=1552123 RepID=A0A7X1CZU0_9LIST|nr:type II toxin-antitoxin system MqsA family antitoxin [Listeria booriae]MBC1560110.1 type II toxin-antitoxin system MqsA family antitoxin [Listeria booriae]MBC1813759.1 type II toxin-antitoxin system MqsA family antitoxin [Listeria booriae]MBC1899006.1 type II toxin-antitoxin system MqsA family antitoxin [Listeria booriae]MBC1907847.1 type II toxin-antitoxin system MqsA family antitoxin [Listeria booriae]MBC1913884.1 type II toxin-antitoxin system MqsA family antitoxin [Listeria booriae]